jgi:hypothetical protein
MVTTGCIEAAGQQLPAQYSCQDAVQVDSLAPISHHVQAPLPELQVQLYTMSDYASWRNSRNMQCCQRCDCAVLAVTAAPADRYVARLAGMMPDDPWELALAEQAYFFCEDIFRT